MKKEIKNFEKIVGIALVVLTVISLIINVLLFTNMIYNWSYDTERLNRLVISKPFDLLLWADNILIYLLSIFYVISAIQSKKDVFIKVSFAVFSILTTIVVSILLVNSVASIFGIF